MSASATMNDTFQIYWQQKKYIEKIQETFDTQAPNLKRKTKLNTMPSSTPWPLPSNAPPVSIPACLDDSWLSLNILYFQNGNDEITAPVMDGQVHCLLCPVSVVIRDLVEHRLVLDHRQFDAVGMYCSFARIVNRELHYLKMYLLCKILRISLWIGGCRERRCGGHNIIGCDVVGEPLRLIVQRLRWRLRLLLLMRRTTTSSWPSWRPSRRHSRHRLTSFL